MTARLNSRTASRPSLREGMLEEQLQRAIDALTLDKPRMKSGSELLGFDRPRGASGAGLSSGVRAASPSRMQVASGPPRTFEPKPRVPGHVRGTTLGRAQAPNANPFGGASEKARPPPAPRPAPRKSAPPRAAAGHEFELKEEAHKPSSGKQLEAEIARYNLYKRETEKKEKGAPSSRDVIFNPDDAESQALVQYTMGEKIGQGAYACVRAGWTKDTGDRVAVKVYDKSTLSRESRKRNVQREVHILAKIRHKHIVGFREWFSTDRHIYIVMEYVSGGSLQSLLRKQPLSRFDDTSAKTIFRQICDGIGFCHSLRVVHRDIKLENVLMDRNGLVKIIDFGFAVAIPVGQKLKVFCGTPSYIAPEIISGQPYGFPGDVWALGILLYVLLAGRFPYKAATQRELYRRIVRGNFLTLENATPEARDLLKCLLEKDQSMRPTLDQVLTGPWIRGESLTSSSSSLGGPVLSTATTAQSYTAMELTPTNRKLSPPL